MNFEKVFIRADASKLIGSGHIMRCLTLANEFIKKKIPVSLLFEEDYTKSFKKFASRKVNFIKINNLKNNNSTRKKFNLFEEILNKKSIIIIDNYNLNFYWQKKIKKLVYKLIVIDDLANRKYFCDLLVDQNYKRKVKDYRKLVPNKCKVLAGAKYVILRDEFLNLKKKKKIKNSILISLGNYDPNLATYRTLLQVLKKNINLNIIAVLPSSSPSFKKIKKLQKFHKFEVYNNIEFISRLMNRSFLAIGAGGTTSWERCFIGLPTIVLKLANNQNFIIKELLKSKIIYYAGNINSNNLNISKGIDYFLNKKNYNISVNNSKNLVDGQGKKRIIYEISKL